MGTNPYSEQTASGYNSNPPADDGTEVASNRVDWATIKSKLADPLKTLIDAVDDAVNAAFASLVDNDQFHVRNDYSAAVDGSTDDSTEIQAAIDACIAAGGGTVIFPPGVMAVSTELTVNSAVEIKLQGAHQRGSTLKATSSIASILNVQASCVGLIVEDLDFDSDTQTAYGVEIDSGATDITLRGCKFRGSAANSFLLQCPGDFVTLWDCDFVASNATLAAVRLDGASNAFRWYGGTVSGTGRGLRTIGTLNDSEGIRLIGVHFTNTGAWNLSIDEVFDFVAEGCTFDQASTQACLHGLNADRVTYIGCYFGAPAGNTTSVLADIGATTGSDFAFIGCRFKLGVTAIKATATATAGQYLDGLTVIGCWFQDQDDVTIALDSVDNCILSGNIDKGTPTNGSFTTASTNGSSNGVYSIGNNHWHTANPGGFDTSATYHFSGGNTGHVKLRGYYESAETSLNNDAQITFAHGLGLVPKRVEVIIRANTATAQGWADNEESLFPLHWHGAAIDDGVDVTYDGTNVYITQGAAIQLLDHTSFNDETITQTEYDWVVRAYL